MTMTFRLLISSFLPFAFSVGAISQDTSTESAAIIVLDASGSMWGKVDGRHKIEIARDVISDTVKDWDANTKLGLIAYGHNRKADCSDIETLIEPGNVDPAAFSAQTKSLNPKGKTPLSNAVLKAAETMDYVNTKATVILVSDGKETCDLDPCAVGKSLEEKGVDFTAHIIGFDVPQEDTAGLQCLAEETGGMFIEAKNAEDLNEALKDTKDITTTKETPMLDEAILTVPAEVPAGSNFDVAWSGPKNRGDYIVVRTPDRKTRYNQTFIGSEREVSPSQLRAPETPGEYTVFYEVDRDTILGQARFTVTPVKASLDAPDTVPAGSRFDARWTGPKNSGDKIKIYEVGGTTRFAESHASSEKHSPAKLKAPETPGEYELRFTTQKGNILASRPFQVTAVSATMDGPKAVAAGSRFDVKWKGPNNPGDTIKIYEVGGTKRFDEAHASNPDHGSAKLNAPEKPGQYELRFTTAKKNILAVQPFEVTPVTATMDAPKTVSADTYFEVQWTGPLNAGDKIKIYEIGGTKRFDEEFSSTEKYNPAKLKAPKTPGSYELRFVTRGGNILAKQNFTVE